MMQFLSPDEIVVCAATLLSHFGRLIGISYYKLIYINLIHTLQQALLLHKLNIKLLILYC